MTSKLAFSAAALFSFAVAAPLPAQMPMTAGMMTSSDVGVSPLSGTSATDYVKMAADSDNFEIQSGRIAASRSRNKAVQGFAKEMASDHATTTKALMAALTNQDRKITPPPMTLSSDNQAKLDLLKKTPKATFDQVYLQQQMAAHQAAWALQKGYATDGTDQSLKQVATTAVPVVEQHLSQLKGMMGAM